MGLAMRYELGAIYLQSLALMNGSLNAEQYNRVCRGPNGTNPLRGETAEEALVNDRRVFSAYTEAYPSNKLCIIENRFDSFPEKMVASISCVRKLVRHAL